jgi:hypothetical protein
MLVTPVSDTEVYKIGMGESADRRTSFTYLSSSCTFVHLNLLLLLAGMS